MPTLPWVLPLYHLVEAKLITLRDADKVLSPPIRAAVVSGLMKLEEYYEMARGSYHTIMATGMFSMSRPPDFF